MTTLSRFDFQELCRGTSSHMNLFDTAAMGSGGAFFVDDVECQMSFDELRGSARLMCEMGDPKPGAEAEVHRTLLELQAAFAGLIDALFVRDALNDRLLFIARIPLHAQMPPVKLAGALGMLVKQVKDWQATVFAGALVDHDQEFMNRQAAGAAIAALQP